MKRLMTVLATAAILAGCSDRSAAKQTKRPDVPKSELTYETMSSNDVLVVVNGAPLTKGMVERQVAVQRTLTTIANPNVKLSELDRQTEKNRQRAERLFIEQRAMLAEAERRGYKLTEDDRKEIRERFTKSVLKGKSKYGLLAGKLSDDERAELDEGLNREKLVQMAVAAIRKETRVTVTDAEAQRKYEELTAYNARARNEEAQIWKNASNAWDRIQGGKGFEAVAKLCTDESEHVNSDMDWGEFEPEFFKNDALLLHYLTVMPVGTVTPPVPGDNGLLIVKLLEKFPVDFGKGQLKPRYRLAKIFFELPETYPLTTTDALKAEMATALSEKAYKTCIETLVASAKVEYPNGKIAMTKGHGPTLTKKK